MGQDESLGSFRLLSFDIYGTLIDWETGIYEALRQKLPKHLTREVALEKFGNAEREIQENHPKMPYYQILEQVFLQMASEFKVGDEVDKDKAAVAFGGSIETWPAFPDTVSAMQALGTRHKLVVLSNVDRISFQKTLDGSLKGVKFDAIYTAEDIGSYKPAKANFEYLIKHVHDDFDIGKDQILHVAQSLGHDHVPAKNIGIESCWVERRGPMSGLGGKIEELADQVAFGWRVNSLGQLAELMD